MFQDWGIRTLPREESHRVSLVRAMLGLNPRRGRLVLDPDIPVELGRNPADRVRAFGQEWGVEAVAASGHVRLQPG